MLTARRFVNYHHYTQQNVNHSGSFQQPDVSERRDDSVIDRLVVLPLNKSKRNT